MQLGALLLKDVRLVVRNRALLVALLAYPFVLALALGSAFQEPPSTLDLALVNQDDSGATVDLGGTELSVDDLLEAAAPFATIHRAANEEAALRMLRAGDVDAALVIPPNFMDDLARLGSNATLQLIVDESDPVRASVARNAVEGAVDSFVERIVQKKIDDVVELLQLTAEGGATQLLGTRIDVLGIDRSIERLNETKNALPPNSAEVAKVQEVIDFLQFARTLLGNSERFLTTTAVPVQVAARGLTTQQASLASVALPGALVLGVFWTGSLASALLAARERETGAHRRLAAAPGSRASQLISKTLVALLAALVPAAIVLAVGIALLGAQVADPAMATLALALAALAAAGMGALAAALARNTGGAALLAVLALVPMLLLGGLFYPIAYMPPAAQAVARILPVTLATDALRDAMLRATPIGEALLPLAGLAITAIVLGAAAWAVGRRGG